jgi:hypothetical protein
MKSVNGVESVDVSLNKGLATMTLKEGNTVTMKQLRDAIAKNGFTTKQSRVTVTGTFILDANIPKLKVSGSGEMFLLKMGDGNSVDGPMNKLDGKTLTVEGTVPEGANGKLRDAIVVSSITEKTGK